MRPTPVRYSHSNRGASRRRSNFVSPPTAKKAAPMTLLEKSVLMTSTPTKVVKAA